MSTRARWTVGLLLAIVVGLAVGLAIVAGGNDGDDPETITVRTGVEETDAAETDTQPTVLETSPDDGGVTPPTSPKPDGTGGLGAQ